MNTILFMIASKRIKHLGMNVTKDLPCTLKLQNIAEIKEDINKQKNITPLQIRYTIVKMLIFPK